MHQWKEVTLDEIADLTVGFVGKTATHYVDKGVRFIRSMNVEPFRINYNDPKFVDQEFHNKIKKSELNAGDVVIVRTGKPGACAVIPKKSEEWNCADLVVVKPKHEYVNSTYLAAFINLAYGVINAHLVGAVQQHFNVGSAKKLKIKLPPIDVQNIVGSFIDNINAKIEVNETINKNLEQQAQAIFDDMFPDIFSLNTDATLQDLIVFANGKKRPKTIGNIPVYGGNGILAYTDKSNADNCVIIGRVGAYCGNTFLCLDKCWTSDNAIQAKNRTGSSPLFIYYLLRNASLSSRHIGTGQPLMTQGILNAIPIKYPVEEKISAFIETCSPIHKMISGNRQQNESLASIRDSMLPKLMSGEMDVSELNL